MHALASCTVIIVTSAVSVKVDPEAPFFIRFRCSPAQFRFCGFLEIINKRNVGFIDHVHEVIVSCLVNLGNFFQIVLNLGICFKNLIENCLGPFLVFSRLWCEEIRSDSGVSLKNLSKQCNAPHLNCFFCWLNKLINRISIGKVGHLGLLHRTVQCQRDVPVFLNGFGRAIVPIVSNARTGVLDNGVKSVFPGCIS